MTKRIFYVVRFSDTDVLRILNALRFISNPKEKGVAHITVRGPRQKRLAEKEVEKIAATVKDTLISVSGIGTFFGHSQNTIFLKCSSNALRKIWKKSDYGYNPHITLYDGKDREIAVDIKDKLNRINLHFNCKISGICPYISHKGQHDLDLSSAFDAPYISKIVHREIHSSMIHKMSWHDRLELIITLARHLSETSAIEFPTSQVA